MAELRVDNDRLHVELSTLQELGAVHRSFSVPLAAIESVQVVDAPFDHLRGWRLPGTAWPKTIALGTWRGRGTRDFVSIHRDERAVLIELSGHGFDRLLIGAEDPEAIASQLG